MRFRKSGIIGIIAISLILGVGCSTDNGDKGDTGSGDNNTDEISEVEIVELTEDRAIEIEEEFIDKIFSPKTVGKTNEIENYSSKEELISDVASIADRDLVEKHVDDYYREEDDKLYVVPKDGPAMILSDLAYSFNRIDDSNYELVQENENQLRGSYRLTVSFNHTEEGWKMTSRDIEIEEN